jgi:serine/threonine-protein kinase
LDFGISKVKTTGSDAPHDITSTQAMLGSPAYMSPEQMKSTKNVDARADIWSLGAVLFELLTGRQPFECSTLPELVAKIITSDPTPMSELRPEVPAPLAEVVHRCLQKDPSDRWQNVAELAAALLPFGSRSARVSVERIVGVVRRAGQQAPRLPPSVPPRDGRSRVSTAGAAPAQEPQHQAVGTQSSWATGTGPAKPANRAYVWAAAGLGLVLIAAVTAWIAATSVGEAPTTATSVTAPVESTSAAAADPAPLPADGVDGTDRPAMPVAPSVASASESTAPPDKPAPTKDAPAPAHQKIRAKPPDDNSAKKTPGVDPLADPR